MNSGILLELLAELFQALLASEGTRVSRRHVFRRGANDIAEVDILVSGMFGSSRMKVALECRDRREPQGKEWIQQIVGKRDDLREFGVRHWIAVSSSGFTEPAEALARRSGVELLVPCPVEPVDAGQPGPHELLQFTLSYERPALNEGQLQLSHEDDQILETVRALVAGSGWERVLLCDQGNKRFLKDEIWSSLQQAVGDIPHADGDSAAPPKKLSLGPFPAQIDEISFTLANVQADIEFVQEEVAGSFRLLTFSEPRLSNLLGLIGLNEFELNGKPMYLLVGFKHGNPGKLVFHTRDKSGAPVSGVRITLDERRIDRAGYHLGPPSRPRFRRWRNKR